MKIDVFDADSNGPAPVQNEQQRGNAIDIFVVSILSTLISFNTILGTLGFCFYLELEHVLPAGIFLYT